jgi:hypothetical protein
MRREGKSTSGGSSSDQNTSGGTSSGSTLMAARIAYALEVLADGFVPMARRQLTT